MDGKKKNLCENKVIRVVLLWIFTHAQWDYQLGIDSVLSVK